MGVTTPLVVKERMGLSGWLSRVSFYLRVDPPVVLHGNPIPGDLKLSADTNLNF